MGVGHLSIGIGQGAAQVYQQSPAIAQFGQILAQQKAKRDADRAYLANELASVQPAGLRNDADRSQFFNQYSQIKQQAIDADNIRDPLKRAMAIANVRQGMMGLSSYVDRSKKQAVEEAGFAKAYMANPDAWTDEAIKQYRDTKERAVADPSLLTDFTSLQRAVDGSKIDAQHKAIDDSLLKQSVWGTPVIQNTTVAGKKAAFITNSREVDPTQRYEAYLHAATVDPHTRQFYRQNYPENFKNNDPQTALALSVKQYADSRGPVQEHTAPQEKVGQQPDLWYDHYNYSLKHPKDGSNAQPGQPQAINIPYAGTGVVHAPNYVPLSVPNKNFAGAIGVNMSTGKPEPSLASSDSYSIVGAGDFPVSKNTGQIAQPNWVQQHPNDVVYKRMVHVQQKDPSNPLETTDHLIPYDNLPKNVANQKDVRIALSGFNKTPVYGEQEKPTPDQFNSQWAKLPKGGSLIGPDGVKYTKR